MSLPPAGHLDTSCPLWFWPGPCEALEAVFEATRPGRLVRILEGPALPDRDTLFEELARSLSFPGYFGRNWDALDECLADLAWLDIEEVLLIFRHAEDLLGAAPGERAILLQILAGTQAVATVFQGEPAGLLPWIGQCRELRLPCRVLGPSGSPDAPGVG